METADRENIAQNERMKKDNGKGIHGFILSNINGIDIEENNKNKMQLDPSLVTGQLLF